MSPGLACRECGNGYQLRADGVCRPCHKDLALNLADNVVRMWDVGSNMIAPIMSAEATLRWRYGCLVKAARVLQLLEEQAVPPAQASLFGDETLVPRVLGPGWDEVLVQLRAWTAGHWADVEALEAYLRAKQRVTAGARWPVSELVP